MNQDKLLNRLPIAKNESIKHVIRHHWIVYAGPYLTAVIASIIILVAALLVNNVISYMGGEIGLGLILIVTFLIIVGIFGLASIPAYMKSQEMLVLTEATLLLQRKPDIFAVQISQLNLQHVEDVNIERGFLGNVFNYGHLNIETAGEMENFIFNVVANVDDVARLIINSHENYMAALQTGHIQTTIDPREPLSGKAWHGPSSWPNRPPQSDGNPSDTVKSNQVPNTAPNQDQPGLDTRSVQIKPAPPMGSSAAINTTYETRDTKI